MATRSLDVTRVVRLTDLIDRDVARNEGTRVGVIRTGWTSLKSVFNAYQATLADLLADEQRPGAMLFLLTSSGIAGTCWLAATEGLRAGTIGRHSSVDLFLPHESGLSLRHCLFLVRLAGDRVVTDAIDLSSSAGMSLEDRQPVRAVRADGHFFLHLPGALLACFPTGRPLPWDPAAMPAFDSLAPRNLVSRLEGAPALRRPLFARDSEEASSVTVVAGPVHVAPGEMLERGEVPAGTLTLASSCGQERLAVGLSALDRGVVVGRYDRCAGGSSALGDYRVSRVHALLVRRDGRVWIADAGSTNGTWLGEEEVRCAPVVAGAQYHLGEGAALAWTPLD